MGNIKHFFAVLLSVLTAVGLCLTFTSCEPEGLVDTTEFSLYYPDIADVGPSSTIVNLTPNYHGEKPSDFKITRITVNGDPFESSAFSVNSETGAFSFTNTDNLPVGEYRISISCKSGGKTFEFEDAITISVLNAVPDGIVATPDVLEVTLADVTSTEGGTPLPTSQITTEGEHISIKGYSVANVYREGILAEDAEGYFEVSDRGVVSIVRQAGFVPGSYQIDFKLETSIAGKESELGLFSKALTVNVTSAPVSLAYSPESRMVEAGMKADNIASPVFVGSLDGIEYSLTGVKEGGNAVGVTGVLVDKSTGVVSVSEGNTLEINKDYVLSVSVKNKFGETGFEDVFTLNVVAEVETIGDFSYGSLDTYQEVIIREHAPKVTSGTEVTYSLVDLDASLADLKIDPVTGNISAPKGHGIPVGKHLVTVRAENIKGHKDAFFMLNVEPNPNYFTYVYWGNNLGLTEEEVRGISQHRVHAKDEEIEIRVVSSDIPEGAAVNYELGNFFAQTDADEKYKLIDDQGTFYYKLGTKNSRGMNSKKVTVTVGEGDLAITRVFPVFIHYSAKGTKADSKATVEYTPFAFACNPKTGATFDVVPAINNADTGEPFDLSSCRLDFRNGFNYQKISGPDSHKSGASGTSNTEDRTKNLINLLNVVFYETTGLNNKQPNYNSRAFLSGIDNVEYLNFKPAYIDQNNSFKLVVNPNLWQYDGVYCNGLFVGNATLSTSGKDPKDGDSFMPLAVWFDEKF